MRQILQEDVSGFVTGRPNSSWDSQRRSNGIYLQPPAESCLVLDITTTNILVWLAEWVLFQKRTVCSPVDRKGYASMPRADYESGHFHLPAGPHDSGYALFVESHRQNEGPWKRAGSSLTASLRKRLCHQLFWIGHVSQECHDEPRWLTGIVKNLPWSLACSVRKRFFVQRLHDCTLTELRIHDDSAFNKSKYSNDTNGSVSIGRHPSEVPRFQYAQVLPLDIVDPTVVTECYGFAAAQIFQEADQTDGLRLACPHITTLPYHAPLAQSRRPVVPACLAQIV